jgi:tetratricopeptide (TPR) repeat protein
MTDSPRMHSKVVTALAGAVLWVVGASVPLVAQELPLRYESGDEDAAVCMSAPAVFDPGPEARSQAAELASSADQSVVLGDLERAATLLERATELDPSSAELAYRRGRVLENLGRTQAATSAYCQVLETEGTEGTHEDARDRIRRLSASESEVSAPVRAAAARAVAAAGAGNLEEALGTFDDVVRDAPLWADAAYNRGVTLARLGRNTEASRELARYLELAPSAPDAVAVSRRIGQLEIQLAALEDAPSPYAALALGSLFPGMGQFYSGRARGGLFVVALTAGTLAGGFFITEVNVRCQVPVEPGTSCPSESVASRRNERPHLWPAVGLAAAVVAFGAAEAFIHARVRRGGQGPLWRPNQRALDHDARRRAGPEPVLIPIPVIDHASESAASASSTPWRRPPRPSGDLDRGRRPGLRDGERHPGRGRVGHRPAEQCGRRSR